LSRLLFRDERNRDEHRDGKTVRSRGFGKAAGGLPGGTSMNLPATATDNISEVLLKIIEFTQTRQKILIQNINSMHSAGFVPKDLAVDEFSRLMEQAVSEHISNQRLLLQDGANIKFGTGGSFEVIPVVDEDAKSLFEQSRDEFLRCQINKLLENSINQRIAVEMLKQMKINGQFIGRCMN
jgi:hypothetical protein